MDTSAFDKSSDSASAVAEAMADEQASDFAHATPDKSADKPAFDKSTAGKCWFGRLVFGGVGKEKKLGSLEKR